jgi:hypothetical protein
LSLYLSHPNAYTEFVCDFLRNIYMSLNAIL